MGVVYLIPSVLQEEGYAAIHPYTVTAIRDCHSFFTENERTTRRYFKQLFKQQQAGDIVIDDYEWVNMSDAEAAATFRRNLQEGKNIGLVSEAGCPGVADPGQAFVAIAQEMGVVVKPLVGPNSILLALMASGMNGQQFMFHGYLPIDGAQRARTIRELEADSAKKNCTQLFIETPYRNNQLLETLLQQCRPTTKLCIAVDITGPQESIRTMPVSQWKAAPPDLHKRPVLFLLYAGD